MNESLASSLKDLRVILAHDWLDGMRGGERCLELLCRNAPEADIYTLIYRPDKVSETIRRHNVHTSALQNIPMLRHRFRLLLPLLPRIVESMQTQPADLLISTSHCVAKGLKQQPGTRHLCYCFTPMRYGIYYAQYFGKNRLKEAVVRPTLSRLRTWDCAASDRVDRFVAISKHIQRRIKYFYGRESDIVYPPADIHRCTPGDTPGPQDYDLIVSALVPYKRVDLAVQAYTRLGFPLKVVGAGVEWKRLRAQAGPSVEFLGWRGDDEVLDLYRGCRLLVFPGEEDFGLVPVEAQACGKPVVAYGRGGALETVVGGETGVFFRRQEEDDLLEAVEEAAGRAWDPARIRRNAERFSTEAFLEGLDSSIQACLQDQGPSTT